MDKPKRRQVTRTVTNAQATGSHHNWGAGEAYNLLDELESRSLDDAIARLTDLRDELALVVHTSVTIVKDYEPDYDGGHLATLRLQYVALETDEEYQRRIGDDERQRQHKEALFERLKKELGKE